MTQTPPRFCWRYKREKGIRNEKSIGLAVRIIFAQLIQPSTPISYVLKETATCPAYTGLRSSAGAPQMKVKC